MWRPGRHGRERHLGLWPVSASLLPPRGVQKVALCVPAFPGAVLGALVEGTALTEQPTGSVPRPGSVQFPTHVVTFRAEATIAGDVAPVPDPIAVDILAGHCSAVGIRFGPSPCLASR